jgi:hypothetical protein
MASQLFFGFFPPTSERVPRHTDEDLNKRVTTQTDRSVASSATDPRLIDRRLRELDWEWDIERALEANAAVIALTGPVLGRLVNPRWYYLSTAVPRRPLSSYRRADPT